MTDTEFINKQLIDEQLQKFLKDTNEVNDLNKTENKTKRWNFANDILYDMCKENPKHENEHVIVAKIWLIGRSYAAAIERTEKAREANDFYYEKVVPKVSEIKGGLDSRIAELNNGEKYERLSRDNLDKALEAHNFLMKEFNKITGKDNRSLVSKYLHFHCPSMFYIYDSRAVYAMEKLGIGKERLNKRDPRKHKYDKKYVTFCDNALDLQEYIEKEHGQKVTPRDIDNFLLYYCD